MNKRDIGLWQLVGFVAVSALGTLLHYLYDWTNSTFAALFSAVNESTWEHMKLTFFPMVLFAVVQSFFIGKEYENFRCIKLKGTVLGLLMIPTVFYTLRGIFGTTADWVNIAIFFISVAAAYIYETRQFKKGSMPCKYSKSSIVGFCLIALAFWIFTFVPPEIPLFQDPMDGSYGLVK